MTDPAYFNSPQQAVQSLREKLIAEAWADLARYYDLSGTDIPLENLLSGEYFARTVKPEIVHPAENWRIKHPFDPSFDYSMTLPTEDPDVFAVRLSISIDQGSGSPVQEGWSNFE